MRRLKLRCTLLKASATGNADIGEQRGFNPEKAMRAQGSKDRGGREVPAELRLGSLNDSGHVPFSAGGPLLLRRTRSLSRQYWRSGNSRASMAICAARAPIL